MEREGQRGQDWMGGTRMGQGRDGDGTRALRGTCVSCGPAEGELCRGTGMGQGWDRGDRTGTRMGGREGMGRRGQDRDRDETEVTAHVRGRCSHCCTQPKGTSQAHAGPRASTEGPGSGWRELGTSWGPRDGATAPHGPCPHPCSHACTYIDTHHTRAGLCMGPWPRGAGDGDAAGPQPVTPRCAPDPAAEAHAGHALPAL